MFYKLRKNIAGDFKIFTYKQGTCKSIFVNDLKNEITFAPENINEVLYVVYNQLSCKLYSDKTKRVYETLQGALKMFNEKYLTA